MNKELSVPLTSTTAPATKLAAWQRTAGIVLVGSAFVAVCAHIALPLVFTPVPLTLQPFAVLVLGLLLGPRLAAATLAAYLAEGALGLPVFAPSATIMGGMAHLFGPTGGYLLAYPAAAALISFLWRRSKRGFAAAALSAAAGDLFFLVCGGAWLAVLTHASLQSTLGFAVWPFLPGDALKVAAAAGIAVGFQRLRRRSA
ncbi:MAG TPA: biotin transporter BioY [Terracidiphilus sp.]|nr:biotin transporter BioY [Terracidiphilus sp.]